MLLAVCGKGRVICNYFSVFGIRRSFNFGGVLEHKPILLLADSQNLFWQKDGNKFLAAFLNRKLPSTAVYIGAANDDQPEFFQLFQAAMLMIGIQHIWHVRKNFSQTDRQALEKADLILLGGGDVINGWKTIKMTGMAEIIVDRYYKGAYLMGVSAGSIHLGLMGFDDFFNTLETLKLVPFVIDVHQEQKHWARIKRILQSLENQYVHGLGIPLGSGIIYHSDHTIEAIRKPAWLFEQSGGGLKQQLVLPKQFSEIKQGTKH